MSKFELTLSTDYVPNWGVYEGVREIIQNALDSRDDGYPLTIIPPTATNPTLTVINQGARLERSVWLMGVTSKSAGDHRGCHGEGLKVGALALARAGRRISLVNGDEAWRIALEFSKTFTDHQVLTIYTRKTASDSGGFGAKIQLSVGEWDTYKRAFLELAEASRIATRDTEILLEDDQRGRLYVKGILVEERPDLAFGYNFRFASTDRDRRMISSFDFDWYTSRAWLEAIDAGPVDTTQFLEFLYGDTPDVRGFSSCTIPLDTYERVANVWHAKHGDNVIPVQIEAQLNEAEHIGKVGIVVPGPVYTFFQGYEPLSLELLKKSSTAQVLREYRSDDLSDLELGRLAGAIQVVEPQLRKLEIDSIHHRLQVVDFSNPDVLGMHIRKDGRTTICISRTALADSLQRTIQVLVHEVAHDRGGDGSASHERTEGTLFSAIIAELATTLQRFPRAPVQQLEEVAA